VEAVAGREVFRVDGGALIACLGGDHSPAVVRDIAGRAPARAVFRDSGFATDADRINAERAFASLSPATEVLVI
jgi:adenine-specific DNA-methyltransferase